MGTVSTIGLDIAKSVFQVHGVDGAGAVVVRRKLTRGRVLAFFEKLPRCLVGIEACSTSHYWARELIARGHDVRLLPAQYVKPYLKRQKNDAADAEAICEAAQRPSMRFVPLKEEEQQASSVVFRARDLLVRQRTQTINALRGHLAEYGWIVPKGVPHVDRLIARVEDPAEALPTAARTILLVLVSTLRSLDQQIAVLDAEIASRAKNDPVARRLMTIPGIGPITATALVALAPSPEAFKSGRHFAAWLGLTPRQRSTGGQQKLGAITKMGERTLRRLLTIGASAVIKQAVIRGAPAGSWLSQMLERKPKMLVIVALANKNARIVWALLAKGDVYRAPVVSA